MATGNDILLSFESFSIVLPNSKESRIRIHSAKSSGDYPLLAPITVFQPPPTPPPLRMQYIYSTRKVFFLNV